MLKLKNVLEEAVPHTNSVNVEMDIGIAAAPVTVMENLVNVVTQIAGLNNVNIDVDNASMEDGMGLSDNSTTHDINLMKLHEDFALSPSTADLEASRGIHAHQRDLILSPLLHLHQCYHCCPSEDQVNHVSLHNMLGKLLPSSMIGCVT